MGRDMFDTMTLTKIVGGFCGTFLVFLLGGWVAESIYHSGGHGEGEQAYVIEVPNGRCQRWRRWLPQLPRLPFA